jgi:hypothetical protein
MYTISRHPKLLTAAIVTRHVNYSYMFRTVAVFLFCILGNLANSTLFKTFTTPNFRNPYYVTSVPLRTQEPPTVPVSKCGPLGIPVWSLVRSCCTQFVQVLNIYLWVISQYCQYLKPYSVWMVGRSGRGLIWGTITAFAWRGRKPRSEEAASRPKFDLSTSRIHVRSITGWFRHWNIQHTGTSKQVDMKKLSWPDHMTFKYYQSTLNSLSVPCPLVDSSLIHIADAIYILFGMYTKCM